MKRAIFAACVSMSLMGCMSRHTDSTAPARPMADGRTEPQMAQVLNTLAHLNPKPLENLSAKDARRQPTPADAVNRLLMKNNLSTTPPQVADVDNRTISENGQRIKVRVYTPYGTGPFPVIVYAHGGGWVIADLDTYDASARALATLSNAVVVSVDYRQAPEYRFPTAHEEFYAATQWVMKNAKSLGGDHRRVAVAGESAGGNLAAASVLMAKDRGGMMPVHQLLIYPIAAYGFDTPSYQENAYAKPLNRAMMEWFFDKYLSRPADRANKYVALVNASPEDLRGLPPATIITAEIDPLRSEGEEYAEHLRAAGVDVSYREYDGVTHEFFGMAPVVTKAQNAQQFAAMRLESAFYSGAPRARLAPSAQGPMR